jgi:hypothetical protein
MATRVGQLSHEHSECYSHTNVAIARVFEKERVESAFHMW